MPNLTVVIESDTLKRARMRALAEGTSTSDEAILILRRHFRQYKISPLSP